MIPFFFRFGSFLHSPLVFVYLLHTYFYIYFFCTSVLLVIFLSKICVSILCLFFFLFFSYFITLLLWVCNMLHDNDFVHIFLNFFVFFIVGFFLISYYNLQFFISYKELLFFNQIKIFQCIQAYAFANSKDDTTIIDTMNI